MPETIAKRPLPLRPQTGLLAWQATIGYISAQYSLDAMLTLRVSPAGNAVTWGAIATWGQSKEAVADKHALPNALRDLWREVDRNHVIFESTDAVVRRPSNYADNEWLDEDTRLLQERLIQVIISACGEDWLLVLMYQPVESPETRWQARLVGDGESVRAAGHGATMRDACRDLYRNAAHHFVARSGKSLDDIL